MREEFGPPARLPGWATALLALAAAGIALAVLTGGDGRKQLVLDDADPPFNVLYDDGRLERRAAGAGEVLRLEGRGSGLRAEVVVRPVELPEYEGDVSSGFLPVLAERLRSEREADLDGFRLTDEGRARVQESPGYQIGYRAGDVSAREVFVVEDAEARRGYLVSLVLEGRTGQARKLAFEARRALRSFHFGTGR